jgi:RNA polymerase sigma-70 factor (ECF subfamily)
MHPVDAATPSPPPSLEELVVRYQQADTEAAAALVDLLSPRLFRFFASQLGMVGGSSASSSSSFSSSDDASDLLQETWLRIHRVRHTYRPGMPLLPWVYAIAHRVRIDGFRRRRHLDSKEIHVDVLPEASADGGSGNGGGRTAVQSFDEMLAFLPESQKEVVTMLKVHGLSIEEIAKATSTTAGAVKQKAHRAYERLRSVLESQRSGAR